MKPELSNLTKKETCFRIMLMHTAGNKFYRTAIGPNLKTGFLKLTNKY